MSLPYSNASSGAKARAEVVKILQRFGCESVGFMDEFATRSVILAFVYRGRSIHLRASAQGWANAWLRENPWTTRRHYNKHEWEERAIKQGMIAIDSIIRDWVKGQMTAIDTGILSFEHVFMPYMLTSDGRTLVEHMEERLPELTDMSTRS